MTPATARILKVAQSTLTRTGALLLNVSLEFLPLDFAAASGPAGGGGY